ncbi:MAG: tRNA epoxyqueuosine(34) reductase QueG [Fidelibacterota bacterium]
MGSPRTVADSPSPSHRRGQENLTRYITERALALGFNKVGIAPAGPLEPEGSRLQAWVDFGYHATMEWMSGRVEERKDIRRYFPEARSVVSVILNYFHGTSKGTVKISNYAWGDDYHEVMKKKLAQLIENIREVNPDVKGLVCVDTSPLMEKAWAQRCGIGWVGKHTNLITRDTGSWVFLGELILDCELRYDAPFHEDLCGSCTACLEACPTGAIVDEYVIDSNLCISYLTIEHRGDLPAAMSDQLHGWIYGCDVCQEVCPWNIKFGQRSGELAFAPREEIKEKQATEWNTLSRENYGRLVRNSALKRAKFEGLRRNILANHF